MAVVARASSSVPETSVAVESARPASADSWAEPAPSDASSALNVDFSFARLAAPLSPPLQSAPAQSARASVPTWTHYTVRPGDSLAAIAERFDIDVPTLLGANDLDDPDLIPSGLELTILPLRGVLYRVADGDTLLRIAQRYEVEIRDILRANDLENSDLIVSGQDLLLPGAKPLVVRTSSQTLAAQVISPPAAGQVSLGFLWPANGPITTYFGEIGWTSPRGHSGLDIAAPWGAPVAAAAEGRVLVATRAGGPYGIQVILDHGGGLRTVYGHLSQLNVLPGEEVARGELIGLVGSTGFSTGPHLHFEVRQSGEPRNPLSFLP
jgi:murein DD-endopeptidase MepM/ murein hydrolase activator NlpD